MSRFFIAGVLGVLASCQGTNPATCEGPNRTVDGVCRRGCRNVTECLLGEACVAGTCQATLLPVAVELTATPSQVPRGADVQLRYVTARANHVHLESRTDGGAVDSLLDTAEPSGTFRLVGVQEALVVVLRAENSEGTDVRETPISIVGDGPRVWSFDATPSTVQEGDPVTLSWMVTGATNIEIRGNDSGRPELETTELMSTVSVTPLQTTTYRLIATNGAETAMASVSVTVQTAGSPTVLRAEIDAPELAVPEDGAVLSWQTENATEVVVHRQGSFYVRYLDPDQVKNGATIIEVGAAPTTWEVVAKRGNDLSPAFAVPLAPVPGVKLESLTIDPDTLPRRPTTVNAHIEWGLVGDVASVAISGGGTSVRHSGSNIPSLHRVSVRTNRPTTFLFTATGPRGFTVEHQVTAWPTTEEWFANNTRATAQRIDEAAVVEGELAHLPFLEDWYVLSVAANETLRVRFDGDAQCPSSIAVRVYDGANDVPKETFSAPTMDDTRAVYVPDLPAGDVFVQVTAPTADIRSMPCGYTLYAEPFPPACGNGMVEAGEECDDGNTLRRDGCDPTCAPPTPRQYTVRDEQATALGPRADRVKLWRRGDGTLPPEDDGIGMVKFPFDFPFYGRRHRAVMLWTHGTIQLSGVPNPDSGAANAVALFGVDLQFDPNDPEAGIFAEVRNGPTGREVAISFRRMRRDGPSGAPIGPPTSAAIILSESGRIELTYPEEVPSEFGEVFVAIQSNDPDERPYGHPASACRGIVCPNASILTNTRATFDPID